MLKDKMLEEGLADPWREFLEMVLKTSVQNCRWLSRAVRNKRKCLNTSYEGSWAKRLIGACVAWRWIFGGRDCPLPFSDLCDELGVDESYIRARILGVCPNQLDINQVVDHLVSEMPTRLNRKERDRGEAEIVVEWESLKNVRSMRA